MGTGYMAVNKAERLLLGCRIRGKRVGGLLQTLVRGPLRAWHVGRDLREVRAAWLGEEHSRLRRGGSGQHVQRP